MSVNNLKKNSFKVIKKFFLYLITTSIALLLLTLSILYTDLFYYILLSPLTENTKIYKSEAIAVFGGGLNKNGGLGSSTLERINYAIELYNLNYAKYVIITGGYLVPPKFDEVQVMANELILMGVPPKHILIDNKARNTFENAKGVYALCKKYNFKQIILVTSPYHIKRAKGCLIKYPITVLSAPVKESEVFDRAIESRNRSIQLVMHEYGGLLVYWLKGWI